MPDNRNELKRRSFWGYSRMEHGGGSLIPSPHPSSISVLTVEQANRPHVPYIFSIALESKAFRLAFFSAS